MLYRGGFHPDLQGLLAQGTPMLCWVWLGLVGLGWFGLSWVVLVWVGLCYVGLGWFGLGWIRLVWHVFIPRYI